MAGGGSSGKVSYAGYIEDEHGAWLDDIDDIIDANLPGGAVATSPYSGETAYDPATPIATAETRMTDFAGVVTGINETNEWEGFVDRALTKADEVLFDETVLKDARDAFSNRVEDSFLTGINSLSAWAGGVGATDSSSFHIGLALLEMDRTRKVDDFDSTLHFELYKLRGQYMIQGTQQMAGVLAMKVEGEKALTAARSEVMRATIIANKEEADRNIEMDVQDGLWDIKLFEYGGHMLAAVGSGISLPREPSPLNSALAGAAGGFAAGGPIGAAIGGAAGLLSSIF